MATSITAARLADAAGLTQQSVLILQAPASDGAVARAIAEAASRPRVAWPPAAYTAVYAASLTTSIAAGATWAVGLFITGALVVYLAACAHRRRAVLSVDRFAAELLARVGADPTTAHAAVPRTETRWHTAGGWILTTTPTRRTRHTAIAATTGQHYTTPSTTMGP